MRALAAMLLAALLTGCIELTEEIWVGEDGRCRVEITTGIAEKLLDLNQREDARARARAVLEELRVYGREKLGARASLREYVRDDMQYFALVANLEKPEDVATLINHFHAPDAPGMHATHTTRFSALGSDTLRFEKRLRAGDAPAGRDDPKLREWVARMFEDSYLVVRLHAESVRSVSGQVADDGRSVAWRIPFADFIREPGFDRILAAEMPRRSRAWIGWLAAGLALAGLLGYLYARRRVRD